MSNRLKNQSSPYLLQHAENPVDWYPWGEEAFEKAKLENKPIFLSIGYSTCHWCHVMAHESFENKEIAKILNQYFISIKVDREERPDIDSVYMSVCQALTGSGGWPMSIFMTAQQKPFFAGTYYPPTSRAGMTGFRDLLLAIADKWKNHQPELSESANHILAHINTQSSESYENINSKLPKLAVEIFSRTFDEKYGGFGSAPKFPIPHNLIFLMLYSQINKDDNAFKQAEITLEQMRKGGIFDHIGYGFSRYSTDSYYLVPHFEKMLYDNALLIMAYSIAYKISGNKNFLDTAEKTADYIFREMTGSHGEFYSAQDADSEGEEGKYYIWDYKEICDILEKETKESGKSFCEHFGVTRQGNFEGKNILNLLNENSTSKNITSDHFDKERKILYRHRKKRATLHLDDKVLTSWNSLMISAMSLLYRVTGNRQYLSAAEQAYQFIEENLTEGNLLYVSYRDKVHSVKGFFDEYAYYTAALLFLYAATSHSAYLKRAEQICAEAQRQFVDKEHGGYFLYGTENSNLIAKPKETYDGALPSGNSVMAYCLVLLSHITDIKDYQYAAEKQLAFLSAEAEYYPAGYSVFLIALLLYLYPPQKITVVLAKEDCAEQIIPRLPLNANIKILEKPTDEYKLLNDKTTYYVCKNHTCFPPSNQEPILQ